MVASRIALLILFAFTDIARAGENWPQWRGPTFNGQTDSRGLPTSWSETERVKWKTRLPSWSGATPIIWGPRVFVISPSSADSGPHAVTVKSNAGPRPEEG